MNAHPEFFSPASQFASTSHQLSVIQKFFLLRVSLHSRRTNFLSSRIFFFCEAVYIHAAPTFCHPEFFPACQFASTSHQLSVIQKFLILRVVHFGLYYERRPHCMCHPQKWMCGSAFLFLSFFCVCGESGMTQIGPTSQKCRPFFHTVRKKK